MQSQKWKWPLLEVATSRNPSLSVLRASTPTSAWPVNPISVSLEEREGPVSSSIEVPELGCRQFAVDKHLIVLH